MVPWAIVALQPSTTMPSVEPFRTVTPAFRPVGPIPICPLLPRPTKMLPLVLVSTTPPTTVPDEFSVMAIPFPVLPLTVTGFTVALPSRSWPTLRYELRVAVRPPAPLPLTTLLVTTAEEVFEATTPVPLLPVIWQPSMATALPYALFTPTRVAPVSAQFLSVSVEPRSAAMPKSPPFTVRPPEVSPSMTTRWAPSRWIVGRLASAAVNDAGPLGWGVMVTSLTAMTKFSVQSPFTWMIAFSLIFAPTFWPLPQSTTTTASAAPGSRQAPRVRAMTAPPIQIARIHFSLISRLPSVGAPQGGLPRTTPRSTSMDARSGPRKLAGPECP